MSRKTSLARRAAFFRALAETGNQTLAAERAKVSRSWVQLHRSTDPAFAAAVREAVVEARAELKADPHPNPLPRAGEGGRAVKPPGGWGSQSGEELVVNGSARGPRRIARARLRQWTPRIEARFLAALAACANVKHALADVGLTPAAAYNHRKRWPDFASRWDAAVAEGRERVERELVAGAIALLDPEVERPEGLAPMSVQQAITVARITRRRGGLEPRERWIRCDRCRKRVDE